MPLDILDMLVNKQFPKPKGDFDLFYLPEQSKVYKLKIDGDALNGVAYCNQGTGYDWIVDMDSARECGVEGSIILG